MSFTPFNPPAFVGTPKQLAWARAQLKAQQDRLWEATEAHRKARFALTGKAAARKSMRSATRAIGQLMTCIKNKAGCPPKICGTFPHQTEQQ